MKLFFLKNRFFKKGFSLLEILIFIALFGLIVVAAFVLMDPFSQIKKAHDTKRKKDLDVLKKAFEDYYNDKGCYPKPEEVCYPGTIKNVCEGTGTARRVRSKICYICGNEASPPNFSNFKPYLEKLPCDPEHPRKKYLYEVQMNCQFTSSCRDSPCDSFSNCSSWYRVYSDLNYLFDGDSQNIKCLGGGCGLAPTPAAYVAITPYLHDYGISSPNIDLERTTSFYCKDRLNNCNGCGSTFTECYYNRECPNKKTITTNPHCSL